MGPPTLREAGHTYIFVATFDLTKYSIAVPTMGHTASITADCFMKEIILRFGFPSLVTFNRKAEQTLEYQANLNYAVPSECEHCRKTSLQHKYVFTCIRGQ